MKKNIPRSSKLSNSEKEKTFYKYYAGFSNHFVEDMIRILELDSGDMILDPWNGSGTTTYIASTKGYNSIGLDINPVMNIVAKARLIGTINNKEVIAGEILKQSRKYRKKVETTDTLCEWFSIGVVQALRNIERSIFEGNFIKEVLINKVPYTYTQAFYCLALFNLVKLLASTYKSSNPTWIKKPSDEEKISFSRLEIESQFKRELEILIKKSDLRTLSLMKEPEILIAKSEQIPLEDFSVDAVITSPPYCTRIDYAIMTRLELAVLGISNAEFKQLRHALIGAPVVHKIRPQLKDDWGETCIQTLNLIKNHYSKASNTYYFKTYLQYFDSIYTSLVDINRVLKNNGTCVLVVQNSFYKDLLVDLKKIIIEMTRNLGWDLVECYEFLSANNMVGINVRSRDYRNDSETKEVAIILNKGEK
jgi:DNA modification methylase